MIQSFILTQVDSNVTFGRKILILKMRFGFIQNYITLQMSIHIMHTRISKKNGDFGKVNFLVNC